MPRTKTAAQSVTVEHLVPYDTPPYDRYEHFDAEARNIREVERERCPLGILDVLYEADITGVPWADDEDWIIRQRVTVYGPNATLRPDGWYLDRMAD